MSIHTIRDKKTPQNNRLGLSGFFISFKCLEYRTFSLCLEFQTLCYYVSFALSGRFYVLNSLMWGVLEVFWFVLKMFCVNVLVVCIKTNPFTLFSNVHQNKPTY